MRQATALFLALFLSGVLAAQPCDPTGDEVCPDTTDWHRYVPLEVGNQWQYTNARFTGEPVVHWSWRIIGETEAGEQSYFEIERCDETDDGGATCSEPVLVRYDDVNAMLVRRDGDGEIWWDELPCRLDVGFNEVDEGETYACIGAGTEWVSFGPAQGAYGAVVTVPPDEVEFDTHKSFSLLFARDWELFAGLGVTKFYYELNGEPAQLVHALVGDEQVGTPAFATCDPADLDFESEISCPDTTDWRSYFPLEVGNQWQYVYDPFLEGDNTYRGVEITESQEIEGREYFHLRYCDRMGNGSTCRRDYWVRYDEEGRGLLERREVEGEVYYFGYLGDLSAPFVSDDFSGSVQGEYGFSLDLGLGPTVEGTRKWFFGLGGSATYLAGLGPIHYTIEASPDEERLVFARINGVLYGTPRFSFPTSDDPTGTMPTPFALRDLYPNPARDAVTVIFTLDRPQAVTAEVTDVLGRVVRTMEERARPAGPHELHLATEGLASGVYVLRLRGFESEAARRFVVVR